MYRVFGPFLFFFFGDEVFSFSIFLLFDSIRFDFQPRTKILFDGETNARKIHEIFIPIIRFILHVFCNWL